MAKSATTIPVLQPHADRLAENIARAHNLVSIYEALAGHKRGRKSVGVTDVLRSAVVLLHASLEDFLRSIARTYLPGASPDVMNLIPLKQLGRSQRGEKFSLGHLNEHRGKTVDDLIEESVEAFLDRSNYSNTTEVAALMKDLRLDPHCVEHLFADLDRMMRRRHEIVHRADCSTVTGRGRHRANTITQSTVEKWINVVVDFQQSVLYEIEMKHAHNV